MMAVNHKFEGGRFVTHLSRVPWPIISRPFGFGFVAGNVAVGKFNATSAYTREARRCLFRLT